MSKFYFSCNMNPSAPLLVLDSQWEADEMRTNPAYDPVDADGMPIVLPDPEEKPAK